MRKLCKNCKHFVANDTVLTGRGKCLLGDSTNGVPDEPTTLAYGADYESYSAELAVSPNFGCVQFAPKEVPKR